MVGKSTPMMVLIEHQSYSLADDGPAALARVHLRHQLGRAALELLVCNGGELLPLLRLVLGDSEFTEGLG